MNTADAAYDVAHDYPGGLKTLAARMDANYDVLRNKLNPNPTAENRNVLTLKEAVKITDLANDNRILQAWASERDCILVQLPKVEECDNVELLAKFTQVLSDMGELAKTHSDAIADGVVNDREKHDLEQIAAHAHRHIQELLALTFRIYCPQGKRGG